MVLLRCRYFQRTNLYRNYQFISGIRLCSTAKIQNETLSSNGFDTRIKIWQRLKAEHDERILSQPSQSLKVRMQNDKTYEGILNQTTPFSIYNTLNDGNVHGGLVASVNGQLWDMNRPLEGDCSIQWLTFKHPSAKEVFWRSSAHILGAAIEQLFGNVLCTGVATNTGFYYDVLNGSKTISENDLKELERIMAEILAKNERFERIDVTKENLLELFSHNQFMIQLIEKQLKSDKATVYRCGTFIDICDGPHLMHTKPIRAFKLLTSELVAHESMDENINRISGISFLNKTDLKNWLAEYAKVKDRNHRKIGTEQGLFVFHELSPGSCFFKPKGTHIYNTLQNLIRNEYRKRGYQEVITPNIYKNKLWKQSGHWEYFAKNMFTFGDAQNGYGLKPMNCPGHCLLFASEARSHRELPLRLADFGVLHRNDTGLTGLTRVRRFQQDDAHIFCKHDQIQTEIESTLDFLSHIYGIFGLEFKLNLSTRPEQFIGDVDVWDKAEAALENSLNKLGRQWELSPKDGAFYGPKIDITIMDSLKREHQCATIQLDFNLPQRFNLKYITENATEESPVMIHRAMFGSFERFIAILIEHFGGRFPFFLSPSQIKVIPVDPVFNDYADLVRQQLHAANFLVEAELEHSFSFKKKVLTAQKSQFNFILIVGKKELAANTVNVRTRDMKIHGELTVNDLIERLNKLRDTFGLNDSEF